MLPLLQLYVEGQSLTMVKPSEKIVADSVNYLEFVVFWTEETKENWAGLNVYAEFTWNRNSRLVKININEINRYFVPWRVISTPGFSVSIFGTDSEVILQDGIAVQSVRKRITTNAQRVEVFPSGLNLINNTIEDGTGPTYPGGGASSEELLELEMQLDAVRDGLEETTNNLENFIKDQEKDSKELQDNINSNLSYIRAIQSQLKKAKEEISELFTISEKLSKDIENNLSKIDKNAADIAALSESILAFKALVNNKFSQIDALFKAIQQSFNSFKDATNNTFSIHQTKINELFQQNEEQGIELLRHNDSIENLDERLTQLFKSFNDYRSATDNAIRLIRENIVLIEKEIKELHEEDEAIMALLEAEVRELEEEILGLKRKDVSLDKDIDELKRADQLFSSDLTLIREDISKHWEEILKLSSRISSNTKNILEIRDTLVHAQETIDAHTIQIKDILKKNNEQDASISNLNSIYTKLSNELKAYIKNYTEESKTQDMFIEDLFSTTEKLRFDLDKHMDDVLPRLARCEKDIAFLKEEDIRIYAEAARIKTKDDVDFIVRDYFNVIIGKNIGKLDLDTGKFLIISAYDTWRYSDFIEITSIKYVANDNGFHVGYYRIVDNKMKYIRGELVNYKEEFYPPKNAEYMVICALANRYDNLIVQEGPHYRDFEYKFDKEMTNVIQYMIDSSVGFLLDEYY
jgi:chromosome segregation ATPase